MVYYSQLTTTMTFGEYVKSKREKMGITIYTLSKKTGEFREKKIAMSYLTQIEEGQMKISVEILCALAFALNGDPAEFVNAWVKDRFRLSPHEQDSTQS